jgi:hypothetical protein
VREIVTGHGGTVTAEPARGGGTTMRLALPLIPARPDGETAFQRTPTEAAPAACS